MTVLLFPSAVMSIARSEPVWPDRERKRNICCGPPVNNVDFAVHKVLPVGGEGKRFEFRAEFFNRFNHTQYNNPDGNTTDGSDFGRIIRAKQPRLIQLALKFYF
jgi:hypothetical protein